MIHSKFAVKKTLSAKVIICVWLTWFATVLAKSWLNCSIPHSHSGKPTTKKTVSIVISSISVINKQSIKSMTIRILKLIACLLTAALDVDNFE